MKYVKNLFVVPVLLALALCSVSVVQASFLPTAVDGNIGIGTAVPSQKLDVSGTVKATAFVGNGSALTNLPAAVPGGSSTQVQFNNAGSLGGASGLVYDVSSGNVGVGTSAPRGKLEVDGSIYVPAGYGNIGLGTTTAASLLTVGATPPTLVAGSTPAAAVKGNLLVDGKIYGDGSTLTSITGAISGQVANYVPRATAANALTQGTIYDNGTNIGIGTPTPTHKLTVDGSIYATGNVLVGNALADKHNVPRIQISDTEITINLQ